MVTCEICEIFSNYYFSYVRDYKPTMAGGNYIRETGQLICYSKNVRKTPKEERNFKKRACIFT